MHELCRALFGIVVSRKTSELRGGGDVLKTEWHSFTYRPDLDYIESSVVRVVSERREHAVTPSGNASLPRKKRRLALAEEGRPNLSDRSVVSEMAPPQNGVDEDLIAAVSDKVQLVIDGGNLSHLFGPFKGGQDLERASQRSGSAFDQETLEFGFEVGADIGKDGLSRPMEQSIQWKCDLVQQATARSDEDRLSYQGLCKQNLKLQYLRSQFLDVLRRHKLTGTPPVVDGKMAQEKGRENISTSPAIGGDESNPQVLSDGEEGSDMYS